MDIHKILSEELSATRVETGYYASAIINTKSEKLPTYLLEFIRALTRKSGYIFDMRVVAEQNDNREYWRSRVDKDETIENSDNIYQAVFTLNVEGLKEEDFEEYISEYIYNDFFSFLYGCGFGLPSVIFGYYPIARYTGIAAEGKKSVILHGDSLTNTLYGVLKASFGKTDREVQDTEFFFDSVGWVRFENCLQEKNQELLCELLDELRIKYEIE